jgi:lysozyme
MARNDGLIIVGGLALLALLYGRGAQAADVAPGSWIDASSIPPDIAPITQAAVENPTTTRLSGEGAIAVDPYVADAAFLFMIRCCEHRYPRDVLPIGEDAPCYTTFYGGARFEDMSDHPVLTGELKGVPLPDAMCIAAGLKPGCVSTAAGAYQFIKPTWERLRNKGDYLEDFSPANQSEAAIRLLEEIGARQKYIAGDIQGAIQTAGRAWASLPGSRAQQNPKAMQYCIERFNEGARLYASAAGGGDDLPPLP